MRDLENFSAEEIEKASQLSPAMANYFRLIHLKTKNFSDEIRVKRHKAWLKMALNTLYDSASTREICEEWSLQADEILALTFKEVGLDTSPLAFFALGKLGSCELNLSSDIDIIAVSRGRPSEGCEAKVRSLIKLLSDNTAMGFVFRVDLDLRPGGSHASFITELDQFEYHYWSQGEPWERLALTRLRGVCGDSTVIFEVEDLARRFSYRKFIDISLLDDLKSLRQKMHQNLAAKGPRPEANIKLAIGGIRDIELFLQSLMVIHGGRLSQLRKRKTAQIAEALNDYKILPNDDSRFLIDAYWFMRDLEHRLQLVRDTQTHTLPEKKLSSELIPPRRYAELKEIMEKVDGAVSTLLGKVNLDKPHLPGGLDLQQAWLEELGYSELSRNEIWPSLIQSTTLDQKNRKNETARQEFLYLFVTALVDSDLDPNMGLAFLLDFIKATRAKSSFYALLIREDQLLKDLALLFSISPYLSQVICSRPELVDSLLLRSQEPFSNDFDQMLNEMAENKLLSEFICALEFLRTHNLENLFTNLSRTADRICLHLLKQLKVQIDFKSDLNILCLGKWGGQDLGLRSDLDFIFVTSKDPTETDFKIAKRFISRLQDPHRGGRLYGLDMRLGPSGTSGPLIVSKPALLEFLQTKAEAWQRQTYLRARYLIHTAEAWNPGDFVDKGLSSQDLQELRSIREKLTTPLTNESQINIKYSRGGLIDTELCIQSLLLFHKIVPTTTRTDLQTLDLVSKKIKPEQVSALNGNYLKLRAIEQMIKLIQQSDTLKVPTSALHKRKLAKTLKIDENQLEPCLIDILNRNEQIIKSLDPIWY